MLRVANKISRGSLIFSSKQAFSNKVSLLASTNPIQNRVMSTPSWPVPYYQRMHKAYPIRQQKTAILSGGGQQANDIHWLSAKHSLNTSLKGRQIVHYTEQHINTKTFLIKKDDCQTMSKAYVNDICQFLDIANRENVKILAGKTLI